MPASASADAEPCREHETDGAPRYRHGPEIGRGGMGRVVEAYDTRLERVVALKEVLATGDAADAKRFAREVRITARLEHASIVPLYDSGTTSDGRPYYVMRRVSGQRLDQLLGKTATLAERLAYLPNALAAIDAIAHAHRRGVLHRDLKPSNILVGELGETVVIDWGLAKVVGEDDPDLPQTRVPSAADSLQTQAGSVFGTPGFMPPEQARGEELGPRSDVFALGATLYQLLAGRPPLVGKSATEVLEKTYRHALVPVAKVCAEAPPELVAIVDKALAAEPEARYANAGALAEDVRRFLTGQLVAAHHYTPGQRVARFVRRHRATLAVAALALAALAVLAVFSVRRIVIERDAASSAETAARAEQREAEDARRRLEEQTDRLRVWRAEALLDANPTQAAAVLEDVPADSPHLAEARASAQAAVVRGVASAVRTLDGTVITSALSPDTRLLAQMMLDGRLAVYDLEERKRVLERTYTRGMRALWVADGKQLLVFGGREQGMLIDVATGQAVGDPLPEMASVQTTERGDRVLYIAGKRAEMLDVATRTSRELPGTGITDAVLAGDGSWYALADATGVTVRDAADRELAHRDGMPRLMAAGVHRLAVLERKPEKVIELELGATPTWSERAITLAAGDHFAWLVYRGDTLFASSGLRTLAEWDAPPPAVAPERRTYFGTWAGDAIIALAGDGTLAYDAPGARGAIHMPVATRDARLVGRPGKSRVAVVGDGRALIYELDDVVAHAATLDEHYHADFVDDDLVALHSLAPEHAWYDLGARALLPHATEYLGQNALLDVDRAGRRVLRAAQTEEGHAVLYVTQPGQPDRALSKLPPLLPGGSVAGARFVPGGQIVFALADRVMASRGSEAPREVAKLDAEVAAVTACGHDQVAAISAKGELVRGQLATGRIDRTHVDLTGSLAMTADAAGTVFVAIGPHLLAWDSSVRQLATLARPVHDLYAMEGGVAAVEDGIQVELVPIRGGKPRLVLGPAGEAPAASADGHLLAGITGGGQIQVVELPSGATWTLPWSSTAGAASLALSPTRRVLVQSVPGLHRDQLVWLRLPEAGGDLHTWLAGVTNAVIGPDGALDWR